jgi:tRNA-2-methylthio-N6-dimethylallyladenosine synthase
MNTSDSERLSSGFEQMGFDLSDNPATADIVVLNTCVVRQSAEDTATGMLGRLAKIKRESPAQQGPLVAVMGCMVGPEQSELKRRFPQVDIWARPQQFAPILESAGIRFGLDPEGCLSGAVPVNPHVASFVPIVHGCDKFCTFCIIPYRRGREISRPAPEIVHEIAVMIDRGVKDITLLGQNVDSYGHDIRPRIDLADLLEQVHEISGLERIRFLTSHPNDMSVRILEAVRDLPNVCENINLPFQAGDDALLVNMRRGYTIGQYLEKISQVKEIIPGVNVTTDLIVGFSGETDDQFERSLDVLRAVEFDKVHVAAYSNREGTYASRNMPDTVERAVKKARLAAVDELQQEIQTRNNAKLVGCVFELLIEGRKRSRLHGRTRGDKLVYVNTEYSQDLESGQTILGEITSSSPWSLEAKLSPSDSADDRNNSHRVNNEKVPVA